MEIDLLPDSSSPQSLRPQKYRLHSISLRVAELYQRHEKHAGIAIFCLGFAWDSLTLTGVDNLVDNLVLLSYLTALGILITWTLRIQCGWKPGKWIRKAEPHFPLIMQFLFGGLFSSYVVFYFMSASWTKTQVFFLILVFLWIGNEFLHHRLQNPRLLACLYCSCLFSFLAFFLPVVTAKIGSVVFLTAGSISLIISFLVFLVGLKKPSGEWQWPAPSITVCILLTFVAINGLYFARLIPPVPLALKSAGIYHYVERTPAGYQVQYVPAPFYRFWKDWDDPFYFSPGEAVFCYTAVFAPKKIRVPILHIWSRQTDQGWIRTDRIRFDISGGRRGGYRGYTVKRGCVPGKWRVEIQTEEGQTLGKIEFRVVPVAGIHPPLKTKWIR